jgi:hypothetical protein
MRIGGQRAGRGTRLPKQVHHGVKSVLEGSTPCFAWKARDDADPIGFPEASAYARACAFPKVYYRAIWRSSKASPQAREGSKCGVSDR